MLAWILKLYQAQSEISQLNVGFRALLLKINKRMFRIEHVERSVKSEIEILNI